MYHSYPCSLLAVATTLHTMDPTDDSVLCRYYQNTLICLKHKQCTCNYRIIYRINNKVVFPSLCNQKSSYKHVSDFGRLRSYWAFFNSCTRPRVNRVLRNQLAGDLFNLLVYRLRCKHNFCHLTRPPSNRESSFRISTLGLYLGNEGKVGWVFAWPVYTAWLSYYYVYKNPITLQWLQTPDFQNSAAIVS